MTVVETTIRRSPSRCWSSFTDPRLLSSWVPGLRRAKVVRQAEGGLPIEVLFEFADTLSYSLIYRYDADLRRVAWMPGVGKRDAVAGFAEFAEDEGGVCHMTYGVQPGQRPPSGAVSDDVRKVVDAFVRWVEGGPR